jgi:hypothetical protein
MGAPHINGFSNCTGAATPLEGLQLPRGKSVTVEGKGPVSAFKVVSKSCHNAPKKIQQWEIWTLWKEHRGVTFNH